MDLRPHAELTVTFGGDKPLEVSVSVGIGGGAPTLAKQVEAGIEAAALDLVKPLAAEELQRISDSLKGGTL